MNDEVKDNITGSKKLLTITEKLANRKEELLSEIELATLKLQQLNKAEQWLKEHPESAKIVEVATWMLLCLWDTDRNDLL